MKLNTYLVFDGHCKEAFEFYEKLLGGKIVSIFPHRGTPAEGQVPPEWLDKIMHARLSVGDSLSDGLRRSARSLQDTAGFLRQHRHRRPCGGGAHLPRAGGEAATSACRSRQTFWAAPLRHGHRPVWYTLDDQLSKPEPGGNSER